SNQVSHHRRRTYAASLARSPKRWRRPSVVQALYLWDEIRGGIEGLHYQRSRSRERRIPIVHRQSQQPSRRLPIHRGETPGDIPPPPWAIVCDERLRSPRLLRLFGFDNPNIAHASAQPLLQAFLFERLLR